MKCPYIINLTQRVVTNIAYNSEQVEIGNIQDLKQEEAHTPCICGDCAGYNKKTEQCEYRGK